MDSTTWLDAVSTTESKRDALKSDLCADEIYYLDVETHSSVFTKRVTKSTVRTE